MPIQSMQNPLLTSIADSARSTRPTGQTFKKSPPSSCPPINDSSINRHSPTIPRCFPRTANRSYFICDPQFPQNTLSNTTNPHRKDCPKILPRSSRRQGREIRRLCHSLTTPLHDTRQLMACRLEIHVHRSQQDPRPEADSNDT